MKALIYKDLLVIRKQILLMLLAMMTLLCVLTVQGQHQALPAGFLIMNFIVPLFSFGYDEQCQFPKFAISGPITRTQYVLSKYVPASVLAVAGGIVSFLMQFYLSKTSFQWALFSAVLTIGTPLIVLSILFPLIFKLGVERARVAMFVCYVIVFSIISGQRTGLQRFLKMAETFSLLFSTLLSVVVIILVYLVSIAVSKQILLHKEY